MATRRKKKTKKKPNKCFRVCPERDKKGRFKRAKKRRKKK